MIETGRYKQWAVLELFGHRKLAGLVTEVELAGERMLRIEVPSDPPATQTYSAKAVFGISEESEDLCRRYAAGNRPSPIAAYELRGPALPAPEDAEEVDDEDFDSSLGIGADDDFGCDLCGEAIPEGATWHSIGYAEGKQVTACDKCARAEADTKPTRIPVEYGVGLVTDRSARAPAPVGTDENRTGNQEPPPVTSGEICPFCKERPLRAEVGLIETTCGADSCRAAEGPL